MSRVTLESAGRAYEMGEGSRTVQALHPTSLVIEHGEFVVIVGPSGSGKTTLLNLVAGLDRPTEGRIRVGDRDLGSLSSREQVAYRREVVGVVFQFHNLLPNLTARENIELAAELVGRAAAVDAALAEVGLADRRDHFPHELSGGEQQRVAVARALVKEPQIVLADEPTGNLDASTGKGVLKLFRDFHARGRTVLLVTHNAVVGRIGTRVISLGDGRVRSDVRNESTLSPDDLDW